MPFIIPVASLVFLALILVWGFFHHRFYRLHQAIQALHSNDVSTPRFRDLKGVIHVHTASGGHSLGTLDEVVEAARETQADFVVITEHPRSRAYLIRYEQPPGVRPILIFGEEREEETRRVLIVPFLERTESLRIAAHWMGAPQETVMEIENLHDEIGSASRLRTGLAILGSLPGYLRYFPLPVQRLFRDRLDHWDDILKQRRVWIVGGNDAHANLGLRLEYAGGKRILDWSLDPYRYSFNYLGTHVLLWNVEPSPDAILSALAQGMSYVSLDFLHDPKGFDFSSSQGKARTVSVGAILRVRSPVPARIRMFRNGQKIREADGVQQLSETAAAAGAYRVELYLPQLGPWAGQNPWIISNPIFVTAR